MNNVGRKLYYDKQTGNILVNTGEMSGNVRATTIAQDIATYKVLSQRVRSTFDVIELAFGQYAEEFRTATSYRVNPITERIEFSMSAPAPSEPTAPPVYVPPLSESIQALADENASLLMKSAVQDMQISALQDENAEFMMRIAMLEMGGLPNV